MQNLRLPRRRESIGNDANVFAASLCRCTLKSIISHRLVSFTRVSSSPRRRRRRTLLLICPCLICNHTRRHGIACTRRSNTLQHVRTTQHTHSHIRLHFTPRVCVCLTPPSCYSQLLCAVCSRCMGRGGQMKRSAGYWQTLTTRPAHSIKCMRHRVQCRWMVQSCARYAITTLSQPQSQAIMSIRCGVSRRVPCTDCWPIHVSGMCV